MKQDTRRQFMDFFRSDKFQEEMTADDCKEIFLSVLKGSSDLSIDLFRELCDNYDTPLQTVLNNWHHKGQHGDKYDPCKPCKDHLSMNK
ncbi:MAG: hypothetical protein KAS32_12420 [Candidatus Peribacteraceae bacterium]|nr:hypothetical protein [Candidatus Peribacteraceae bacterium]